ncbi:hypothetical protein [Brevibacillus reuszeri]|uniref:hypothetical protein n=1 Tax=Brevibacillus reuszeri TaxID=54915 RepID=UPI000CCBEBFE|nr:hypothetical protein [Brevibacillus reuszeri]
MSAFMFAVNLLCGVTAAYYCWTGHAWYKKGDNHKAIYHVLLFSISSYKIKIYGSLWRGKALRVRASPKSRQILFLKITFAFA